MKLKTPFTHSFLPPGLPKIRVTGIDLLDLSDPVVRTGAGALHIHGEIQDSQYLTFSTQVLFHNVRLDIVPEPSAALLGGLGLLAFLRRRAVR
jgi:hypothetical protein